MKKTTLLLLFTALTVASYAQTITLIDFGQSGNTTEDVGWNNVTDPSTLGATTNLVDQNDIPTGEVLELTDDFDPNPNSVGTQSPDGSLPFPVSATRDSFFGSDNYLGEPQPTGAFTLSGLEAGKYYSFTIFASRAGLPEPADNREALYTITGATTETATLDAANNTGEVATILNIQPDINGEITIEVQKSIDNTNTEGFYYIGAMEITKSDNTLSSETKSLGINGTVSITYPNTKEFIKINLNLNESAKVKMDVFNITGKKLTTLLNEEKSVGPFTKVWDTSGFASGVYILNISANGRTQNAKFVIQ